MHVPEIDCAVLNNANADGTQMDGDAFVVHVHVVGARHRNVVGPVAIPATAYKWLSWLLILS